MLLANKNALTGMSTTPCNYQYGYGKSTSPRTSVHQYSPTPLFPLGARIYTLHEQRERRNGAENLPWQYFYAGYQ